MIPRAYGVATAARALVALAALGVIGFGGCGPFPRARGSAAPTAGREILITESEIARMSVRTAWDAVRLRVPRFSYAQDEKGRPEGVRIQPQRSVFADETPLLVVDGARVGDILYLNQIPASDVRAIHILDSEAATPLYGIVAAGGAVVVETKQGR